MTLAPSIQELTRHTFSVHGAHVVVGLVAAFVTGLCVLFHYEVMSLASRLIPRSGLPRRARIVGLILAMIAAHVVEVWIFAFAYGVLDYYPSMGALPGSFEEGALDFVYFSAVTFSSLGFGDIVPEGAIRILAGTETLVGLSLITWSASLGFLEMQRDWHEYSARR